MRFTKSGFQKQQFYGVKLMILSGPLGATILIKIVKLKFRGRPSEGRNNLGEQQNSDMRFVLAWPSKFGVIAEISRTTINLFV